jgi:hypothetical protein
MDGAANVGQTDVVMRLSSTAPYSTVYQRVVDRGVVFSHLGRGKYQ